MLQSQKQHLHLSSSQESEVELRVRPGTNVTLYCDCTTSPGIDIRWYRNCSHEYQPPLVISTYNSAAKYLPRFIPEWDFSQNVYDLLFENITESDLGLYYCGTVEYKVKQGKDGTSYSKEIYRYGNVTTRLSFGAVSSSQDGISAAEVELRVRPGDNITLYCDCNITSGVYIMWFRNCSHEHQPTLTISVYNYFLNPFPRFTPVWNPSNKSYDLLIENITESDLGLYYCGTEENKVVDDGGKGGIKGKELYHYGKVTTWILIDDSCECPDCGLSWFLMVAKALFLLLIPAAFWVMEHTRSP
ncbi:uncharacterized protein [Salvelinus sp. IW2-2015]|uniref:uncharacterized protein n=1 Tax=Salvelinus sp. IW2-2015 TaxID=2691554 RepID=UPI0038D39BEA